MNEFPWISEVPTRRWPDNDGRPFANDLARSVRSSARKVQRVPPFEPRPLPLGHSSVFVQWRERGPRLAKSARRATSLSWPHLVGGVEIGLDDGEVDEALQ